MKINVSRIKKEFGAVEQIEFEEQIDSQFLPPPMQLVGPVQVKGSVTNVGDCLTVKGKLQLRLRMQCNRCLTEFTTEFKAPLEAEYYPLPEGDTEEKILDYATYQNNIIYLNPAVEESILLYLPMKPLCDQYCRGLCAKCGQNLNIENCGCVNDNVDIRLEALKKLLEND